MNPTAQKMMDADNKAKNEAFDRFMANTTNRFLISMVPPSDKPEVLETVLKAAFFSGWNGGVAQATLELLKAVMTSEKKGPL